MSCHDARASFPVLRAGKLRLTELIGPWQIETRRGSLPDPVRVAVKLAR